MKGNITRRGKKSWRVKFDIGRDPSTGKRNIQYHTVKGNRRDAERKLVELLEAVHKANYVEPSKITVAEHVRARVAQWEAARLISPDDGISPKTAERYRELMDRQIIPYLGTKPVQKLRELDIEAWHTTLASRGRFDGKGGVSARTIRHVHRLLSACLDDAVRHSLAARNVATVQSPPKVVTEEAACLDADQVRTVLDGLSGRPIYPIVALALATGMRRGELLALRWANVDLDAKVVRVRESLEQTQAGLRFKGPKSKAGKRDVTLPDNVIPVLRDHRRQQLEQRVALGAGKLPDDALIFPGSVEGTAYSPNALTVAWVKAAKRLGIDASFHALRHTHASHLIDRGVPITMISKRLGHANPNVTLAVYSHMFEKTDSKAAEAINAALAGLLPS